MRIKPAYAYYCAHALRLYFSETQPYRPTRAYRLNRECIAKVLARHSEQEVALIKEVYTNTSNLTVAEKVAVAAQKRHMLRTAVWNLLSGIEREIAIERELI